MGGLAVNKITKPVFFIVFAIIAAFITVQITGLNSYYGDNKTVLIKSIGEIRWGIDIRGGVDVTFTPADDYDATDDELDMAKGVITQRLVALGITDSECYVDQSNDKIIVRFPWKVGESDFDPEKAVEELGTTAMLTFREGHETDENGLPTGAVLLEGKDVEYAYSGIDEESGKQAVFLKFNDEGTKKFADATSRLIGQDISIWMDDTMVSDANVSVAITNGSAVMTGSYDADTAKTTANQINSGALPFKLVTSSFSTISPSLGTGARDSMVISGLIAFAMIAIFMICVYRLPGVVATIALAGQVGGMLCAITGFFGFMNGATLTVPGIAGIILSIGMGVDANVITAERIKEELRNGKTLDGAIKAGFDRGFVAIFDGNITCVFIAVILMGAFGVPDSIFAKLLYPFFFMFGTSTEGAVYSLGYTLLAGIILNFIMGVTATRLMTVSLSKFKALKNPVLYGGVKNNG